MAKRLNALALVLVALIGAVNLFGQSLTPTYEGFYDIQLNGNDSTWNTSFTSRVVGGEVRFLTLALGGTLQEFRLPSAFGQKQSTVIRSWALGASGGLNNFNGLWFEQAKNRLWITSTEDYTNVFRPAHVTLVTLNDNGSITVIGKWNLGSIPEKRVYGGCQPSPDASFGAYVCGWGGYTSLVAQAGGASMGPTMYGIPEPTSQPSGSTLPVRVVLDTVASRGKRATIPQNYFDSGDARQNPSSRPTVPPLSTGQWLSPGPDGKGWFVWGDSYYNTGVAVPGGFLMVASLCKGSCWYQSSTLAFDGRQFELHYWPTASLGSDILARPSQMTELVFPRGNTQVWGGNSPAGNIAGATVEGGKLYLFGCPLGPDVNTCRLYQYALAGGAPPPPPPPPPPTPVDATVSAWSAWSACTNGQQTRTRTVVTPASNGGITPALSESQACTVPPPPPPPPPPPADTLTVVQQCSWVLTDTPPDATGSWGVQFQIDGANVGTRDTASPFTRTTSTVKAGVKTVTAVWSKTGAASVTRTTTKACD